MRETFFGQKKCDRCGALLTIRVQSYFTEETICLRCSEKEQILKVQMREQKINPETYKGCGFVPVLEEIA